MTRRNRQKAHKHGIWAEYIACAYLFLKGYRILKNRYKTPVGEIDIVAQKGKTLVIIEVKKRSSRTEALSSVTLKSQKRIARCAEYFISRNPDFNTYNIRFDVVTFAHRSKHLWPISIRHLDNAWRINT